MYQFVTSGNLLTSLELQKIDSTDLQLHITHSDDRRIKIIVNWENDRWNNYNATEN